MSTTFVVSSDAKLLAFLFEQCPDVKRVKVRQWLKHGSVQVEGRTTTRFDHPLRSGDKVVIRDKVVVQAESLFPKSMGLVFEDDAILVIEKPEKMLSVASQTERDKTAYAYLMDYVRGGDPNRPERVWIVHRLDRETSGLMIFAKSEEAKRVLQTQWYDGVKCYLAVVEGSPPKEQGVFESHLDENGPFKVYAAPESPRTRHAITHYRALKEGNGLTLVELKLETGRRNQIRVHLADAGCPIVGDKKYDAQTDPLRRLALHSSRLTLAHPITGKTINFESSLPHDIARLTRITE